VRDSGPARADLGGARVVSASEQPVPDEAATVFDRHRRLLFTVAYQMLGSVADAEDTVQDAWLRWSSAPRDDVADPKAYLVRVASRLALDRLNSARARRETYVGPWLPEPLLTDPADAAPDPAEAAEIGEQVSLALLVVLETLSPLERAVFVLREVFGMPAAEVAAVLDRSEASVRQVAHRARQHVEARRPRFDTNRLTQRVVTERFFAAVAGGDVDQLMAVLSPGVVLVSDGGGQASAALRPVEGADRVARFLFGIAAKGQRDFPGLRMELADVNGSPAIVGWLGDDPFGVVSLVVVEGRVDQVLVMVNPEKLAGLSMPSSGI
jgi:RNA polymerase sigma-70 factor (TIGR02957 family)